MPHGRIDTMRRSAEIAHLAPKVVAAYVNKAGSVKDIAKSLGVSYVWAYEKIKEAGIMADWRIHGELMRKRQDQDAKVVSLRDQGYSIGMICRLIDMSRPSVYRALKRHGKTNLQKRVTPTITNIPEPK